MLLNLVNTIPLSSFLTAWKYVIPLTMLFFLGILSCFQCSSLSWLTHLHQSSHSLSSSILLIHTLQSTPIPSIVARLINRKLSSTLIFPTVYLTSPFVCFRSSSKQISHTDLIISFPSIFQKLEVILDVLLSCLTLSKQSSLVPEASHSYPSFLRHTNWSESYLLADIWQKFSGWPPPSVVTLYNPFSIFQPKDVTVIMSIFNFKSTLKCFLHFTWDKVHTPDKSYKARQSTSWSTSSIISCHSPLAVLHIWPYLNFWIIQHSFSSLYMLLFPTQMHLHNSFFWSSW